MGPEIALDLDTVDLVWSGPALGGAQHDHRPAGHAGTAGALARSGLDRRNAVQRLIEGGRQRLVDLLRLVALHEGRLVAVALQQAAQVRLGHPRQHCRIGDLVAVEVQDRQHGAVAHRIQELVRMPACGQRAGLGFAVAHDAKHDQVGVVEGGAVGVRQCIPELAALVDRARRFGRDVGGDAAGE